ncbi:TetR/AcrR family transcriptional regulator [Amycolatopsis saalfeldensis]|uniref:DNA-binding transcriptional regulator, AcrR family n=1 Tax=Amycolatopsis saalfeldensis TaxID=394193 RepID=A0A1H8YB61_9PSEU|nr:TetR/AcrR family transcriptional regulator [Amycolatopsis saalfeldensis]SEP49337.1 DNA-binding transcriptional regulator, AcrR family [Amycolatopsis saalfeldensis]
MAAPTSPPRGTRPRNRRELIIAAAGDLFVRDGYSRVAMSDIAEAVAIGPSALYRHFRGKQELLGAVVLDAFSTIGAAVDGSADVCAALADAVLDHRGLGVLWQRECRHLDPEEQEKLVAPLVGLAVWLAATLRDRRRELTAEHADLLAWTVLGALMSVSFQRVELPRPEYVALLRAVVTAVADVDLAAAPAVATPAESAPDPESRRELLLDAAIRLFAERGFDGVAIEEIAAAAGIAGPSIYHHFASKRELLLTAMLDGAEQLDLGLTKALEKPSPDAALGELLGSYAGYSLTHHAVVEVLVAEVAPEPERHRMRQAQHDYIAAWVRLLRETRPGMGPQEARVRVQAVLTVLNDVSRTPHLRALPGIAGYLRALGVTLLAL